MMDGDAGVTYEVRPKQRWASPVRVRAFAMTDDGQQVGEVTASSRAPQPAEDREYLQVDSLKVDWEWRRRGVGTGLLRNLLVWASDNGFSHASVEASASDEAVDEFYRAAGFRRRSVIYDVEL